VRLAKSGLGTLLADGGAIVAAHGGYEHEPEAFIAGLGMIAAGLLTKAGAEADTRYLDLAPQSIYVLPLRLGRRTDVTVEVDGDPGSRRVLHGFAPGRAGDPRVAYVRLHGPDSPAAPTIDIPAPPETTR